MNLTPEERKVVFDAIDALKWEGWRRGSNGQSGAPSCLDGAFGKAVTGGSNSYYSLPGDLRMKLRGFLGGLGLVGWNDKVAHSREHVLWVLAEFAGIDPASVLPDEDDFEVMAS